MNNSMSYMVGPPKSSKYGYHILKICSWSILTSVMMQLLGAFTLFIAWLVIGEESMISLAKQSFIMFGWAIIIIFLSVISARKVNEYFWRNSQNVNPALLFFKHRKIGS